MQKARAALGSLAFLLIAPGVVAGLIPWWLTAWAKEEPLPTWMLVRPLGWVFVGAGALVLIQAFARFVHEGLGTPAPVAPTERLVIGALYRYVRNPMYLAVTATIIGQSLIFGQLMLLLYACAFLLTVAAFVHWYEEPTLRRQFGGEYEVYLDAVPGWWPRRTPWEGRFDPAVPEPLDRR